MVGFHDITDESPSVLGGNPDMLAGRQKISDGHPDVKSGCPSKAAGLAVVLKWRWKIIGCWRNKKSRLIKKETGRDFIFFGLGFQRVITHTHTHTHTTRIVQREIGDYRAGHNPNREYKCK
jgi:hypothetical protein